MTTIPHPEFTLSRSAASPTGAVLADDAKTLIDCFHRDFISFISIAQFHKVDFLPITWNIGLEVLGDGATGEVKQSVVNLKNSFAFKLFKNKDKDSLFRELISEVVLLRQPNIFRHPNIINLEGMAFEVDQGSGEIWPVLIFKKAEFGSLRSFMDSGGGKDISFDRKLKLCSEIGSAIMAMHASDVIHGDIKPENTLVFGDTADEATIQVTDFGYSCIGAKDKDEVYLPVTWGWCAPEYHDRGIPLQKAKKMDIYSFGLVCFWVLFTDDFIKLRADPKMRDLKQLRLSAIDLASKKECPSGDLQGFFDLALCESWETREANIKFLGQDNAQGGGLKPKEQSMWQPSLNRPLTLADYGAIPEDIQDPEKLRILTQKILYSLHLTGTEYRIMQDQLDSSKFEEWKKTEKYINLVLEGLSKFAVESYEEACDTRYSLAHSCFDVSRSMLQLSVLDYRVRVHIAECLKRKAVENECKQCSEQAAFQVAFCYSTGFGIPSDLGEIESWLQRSSVERVELEKHIDHLKRLVPDELSFGAFSKLASPGTLTINPAGIYPTNEQLKGAEAHYRREIKDLENCLGVDHVLTFEMKSLLLGFLGCLGETGEAQEIGWRLNNSSEEILGPEHPFTLKSKLYLADTYRMQEKWGEAEKLVLRAKRPLERTLGHDHPLVMLAAEILSRIYTAMGETKKAQEPYTQLMRAEDRVYGSDPVRQLVMMGNAGWMSMNKGDLEEAEDLLSHAKQGLERLQGPDSELAMMATRNLALTYRKQGRASKAEEMQLALKRTIEEKLGPEHPETLNVIYDLGRTYQIQEKWPKAAEILAKVKAKREKVLGPNDLQTITVCSQLAEIYAQQGRLEEAEGVLIQVRQAKENTLGARHPETLYATRDLGVAYLRQGKLRRAEEVMTNLRMLSEDVLGPEHEETLGSLSNIGEVYRRQGRFREAEGVWLRTKETMERALGPRHRYTQVTANSLLNLYYSQGRFREAGLIHTPQSGNTPALTLNFPSLFQMKEAAYDPESEENLLNAAIIMSMEPDPEESETDEDEAEMIHKAIKISLQSDNA